MGFSFIEYFPWEGISLYQYISFMQDFPLYGIAPFLGISLDKGFRIIRDFPLQWIACIRDVPL